ncbi:hypothetical protein [Bacillus thuringiensis]|uniref:hypothetical protein n=1 Tax=Bacillus thuringiensis TaxID=1428 RepID=UPI0021D68D76|nr:hypothetical protein [Bacillus thuringiensis]MCU7667736.1 hypothetical protein [Bacillus thuringiensis]
MSKSMYAHGEVWQTGEIINFRIANDNNQTLCVHQISNDPENKEFYLRNLYRLLNEIYEEQGRELFKISYYYRPERKYITIAIKSDKKSTRDGVIEDINSVRGHKGIFSSLKSLLMTEGKWSEDEEVILN